MQMIKGVRSISILSRAANSAPNRTRHATANALREQMELCQMNKLSDGTPTNAVRMTAGGGLDMAYYDRQARELRRAYLNEIARRTMRLLRHATARFRFLLSRGSRTKKKKMEEDGVRHHTSHHR